MTIMHNEESPNESINGNSAPVQVVRFQLPKETRDLIIAAILALSVLTNWLLWTKYHDAEKDLQTQIWLRSDSLSKENAELRAHVIAIEDLIQSYGIAKNIPRQTPEKH